MMAGIFKRFCKRILKGIWLLCGAPCGLRKDEAVIIAAHRLGRPADSSDDPLCVAATKFEEYLDWLGRYFTFISLDALVAMEPEQRRTAGRLCALTMDDGWVDNYSLGLPIFEKKNVPATIYLCPGLMESEKDFWWQRLSILHRRYGQASMEERAEFDGPLKDELPACAGIMNLSRSELLEKAKSLPHAEQDLLLAISELYFGAAEDIRNILTWQEARALLAAGCRFGGHGMNHVILPLLEADEAKEEICRTLEEMQRHLPQEGCWSFSYPNGDHGQREIALVRDAGYACAVGTEPGIIPAVITEPYSLPRVDIAGKRSGSDLVFAVFLASLRARVAKRPLM